MMETEMGREQDPHGEQSFVVYEATVTMGSIFLGFVFAALVVLLGTSGKLSTFQMLAVWFLCLSLMCFWVGLMGFHLTAHSVLRYCEYFFPHSKFAHLGTRAFGGAQILMFWSIAAMLLVKEQSWLAVLAVLLFAFGPVGVWTYLRAVKSIHAGGGHVVHVDHSAPSS